MNSNQDFDQRTKNNKYHSYKMWQDSEYFDSRNFDLQRSYQECRDLEESVSPIKPEVKRDYKNRRIILRSSLYDDPDSFRFHNQDDGEVIKKDIAESNSGNNDWTAGHWQKSNETSTDEASCSSKPTTPIRKPNKIEKALGKALSKPVQMSKAESMMQKMGWKGGALGKEGKGILEPIAPNAAYAVSNKGLGHKAEEKVFVHKPQRVERRIDKKIDTKRLQKHERKKLNDYCFKTNTLLIIWDFVRNNRELEVIFDHNLTNMERKVVHLLTECINFGEMVFDTLQQMDIATEIASCNVFTLNTESEGAKPHRSLCLFKSGPDHMFLLTPYEFLPDDPEENAVEEVTKESDIRNKKLADINKMIAENKSQAKKVKSKSNKKDVVENKSIIKISPKNVALNSLMDLTEDFLNKSERNNVSPEKDLNTVIDLTEEITDALEFDTTNPFLASITRHISNDDTVTTDENVETVIEASNVTDENITETCEEIKELEPENTICKLTDNKTKDKLTNDEKSALLLEYFTEFSETGDYSEFKFCGPFEEDEDFMIDKFIQDIETCLAEPDRCKDVFQNEAFANMLSGKICNFKVSEDVNGNTVIYRKQKRKIQ